MTWLDWTTTHWPLLVICAGMLAAAVIDWWKFKVPNRLTFPLILGGWALGLLNNFDLVPYGGQGGLFSALAGTFLGLALLLPVYAIGGMGAGDVKMTMGFGAWVGAFYGFGDPNGMMVIVWAFCAGGLAGGVIAAGMILYRRDFKGNWKLTREIGADLAALPSQGAGQVARAANARRPRWHKLPYGVPLCLGFIGYLVYLHAAPAW